MLLEKKSYSRGGFTLIELVIVIAILAFITVVGIHNYGDIKETQAKKVNLANIKRTYNALATYSTVCQEEGAAGYFNGFDSLIDVKAGGAWLGQEGQYDWGEWSINSMKGSAAVSVDARTVSGGFGIYDGSWKVLGPTYNASGAGSGVVGDINSEQDKNRGMRLTKLYSSLGIYYLTQSDVELLRQAGINYYYLHNPSSQQAHGKSRGGFCTAVTEINGEAFSEDGLEIMGGGPGFRPDMSAFYPTYITNGTPVAVILPTSTIYEDLGFDLNLKNAAPAREVAENALSKVKLLAFGIGRNAMCVRSQIGLGEAPYNPAFDKRNYRQYIAVFALTAGGQGVPSTCRLAGVLDCAGNTYKQAEYSVNWTGTVK